MVAIAELLELEKNSEENLRNVSTEAGYIASGKDQNFGVPFGRDALISAMLMLHYFENQTSENIHVLDPIAKSLLTMIANQGSVVDEWRDEEPGKIHHELRHGDNPKNIEILQILKDRGWPVDEDGMRYYGSVDATLLFISVAVDYINATGDEEFFHFCDGPIKAALAWSGDYGDVDGDLFIEFRAKNRHAILNQGWKDSGDSIESAPSKRPKEPIALVEVQGYTYEALVKAAELYRQKGNIDYSKVLFQRAGALKERFNKEFWMEDEGFFAYALDGDKKQVKNITSNVGHLLKSGIIDDDKVGGVVARIFKPDMLTDYGIRTLSTNSEYFSDVEPAAYHNGGSVWPHDNGLIYLGLLKYGYNTEAALLRDRLLNAQAELYKTYNICDAELFMVTREGILRLYDTAQQPQTWVSATNKVLIDSLKKELKNKAVSP